jgi:pilus assembly protein CpaE
MQNFPRRLLKPGGSIRNDASGASAVEFALLAPILAFGLLCMVDLGMALNQRMKMDSALRAGVQTALIDPGEDQVWQAVGTAADSFTISPSEHDAISATSLLVDVDRFCACPQSMSVEVNCSTPGCASAAAAYVYYKLQAEKLYDPTLLPQLSLRSELLVQIE